MNMVTLVEGFVKSFGFDPKSNKAKKDIIKG